MIELKFGLISHRSPLAQDTIGSKDFSPQWNAEKNVNSKVAVSAQEDFYGSDSLDEKEKERSRRNFFFELKEKKTEWKKLNRLMR